ncbi:hypothetical protein AAEZ35_10970 [Elizabethkingia anophelis subsp. anophelis]|uniref:hypothetical protein n=1 Tax=Elizabethkingia anophelis TaxID=1117645 RepID=UPI00313FFE5C
MIKKNELKRSFHKMDYLPPRIEVEFVETEQCIASGSATVHPGDINNPDRPLVNDWNDNDINGNTDFDF